MCYDRNMKRLQIPAWKAKRLAGAGFLECRKCKCLSEEDCFGPDGLCDDCAERPLELFEPGFAKKEIILEPAPPPENEPT